MRIDVVTVIPEVFESFLASSIIGRAVGKRIVDVRIHDLRDWTEDRHRTTDDYPFGGGPGMVMKPEPVYRAVEGITGLHEAPPVIVLLTPSGERLDQRLVASLGSAERLLLLCGRYEGFDDRITALAHREVSIGDYVLTGGELPAMVVIDAVTRLLPGALGDATSAEDESFTTGLLEYPQYTRPATYRDMSVPDVLVSGDHARIAAWRRREALRRTASRRPDLLTNAALTDEERAFVQRVIEGMESDDA